MAEFRLEDRWRKRCGSVTEDQLKRLRALEKENTRLKRIVADQAVNISILKEAAEGNFYARPGGSPTGGPS
jgi:hypothetical protein